MHTGMSVYLLLSNGLSFTNPACLPHRWSTTPLDGISLHSDCHFPDLSTDIRNWPSALEGWVVPSLGIRLWKKIFFFVVRPLTVNVCLIRTLTLGLRYY